MFRANSLEVDQAHEALDDCDGNFALDVNPKAAKLEKLSCDVTAKSADATRFRQACTVPKGEEKTESGRMQNPQVDEKIKKSPRLPEAPLSLIQSEADFD